MVDLKDARREFFIEYKTAGGAICPCCDRYGKLQPRLLNSGEAQCLIWLYRRSERDDHWNDRDSAPRHVLKCGEIAKLAHWGLAVQKPNVDDPKKKESGMWKITRRGRSFVLGRLKVWSHALVYNKTCWGFKKKKRVDILDALGERFDYEKLMRESAL